MAERPLASFELSAEPLNCGAIAGSVSSPSDGAVVFFVGVVRNEARGRPVVRLEYEAYARLASSEMERIFGEMRERFGVERVRVGHRTGICGIGEPSVAIAVAAPHRAAAFDACRYCIDELKKRVPIWKKEIYADGSAWIGERS
ncbi:MAG TPA: molybdenum cofactor biosynthesis protein MoaE [Planctomycetota bacterium]|nr:molybdenum cofactor biosynthesis protein MoaE [Planctomycetota bacterium]